MFEAVKTYLDTHTNKWNSVPILLSFKNDFEELLLQLQENKENQAASRIFLGTSKTIQKRFVSDKADILNDALEAYATIENKTDLEQKAARSFSDLYKLRNQDFITIITETIALLEEHLEELADYGVTSNQITDLKNSFDQFLAIQGKPRQYRIAGKQATKGLSELFEQTTSLLNSKMDKIFKRFKNADATFYNGYRASRTIINN
ncbi:hypothetical protein [Aquimarina sp. I32.4]|uniref:hypothetical protein n=1 Tax=Aquimarina sp. I32.4 TaxID=2053903 RepID=UPI0011AFB67A|nr:hypothetical protein [Aquimarina sp. I32.4]